jgi:hypothetical protein
MWKVIKLPLNYHFFQKNLLIKLSHLKKSKLEKTCEFFLLMETRYHLNRSILLIGQVSRYPIKPNKLSSIFLKNEFILGKKFILVWNSLKC